MGTLIVGAAHPAAALAGVVANVYKQNMINPAPSSSGSENKNQSECCSCTLGSLRSLLCQLHACVLDASSCNTNYQARPAVMSMRSSAGIPMHMPFAHANKLHPP